MEKGMNSTKLAVLRPVFQKKSHSRRRAIFVERAMKKALPLLREFHQRNGISISETELRRIGKEYARELADKIRLQRKEVFSSEPIVPRDFNALVDIIVSKV